jgi:5-methyltetrahydrofolate--homocysteine methyltransferase
MTPPLAEVAPFINRIALFRGQWQFRKGRMSDAEWVALAEGQLEPMLAERLARWTADGTLAPKAIWGFVRAGRDGDAVVVLDDAGREQVRFPFPRQPGPPGLCLADYLPPLDAGVVDTLGIQLATVGPGAALREQALFEAGEFTEYLYLHGLSVELAEATAEWAHARMRAAWGIGGEDSPDPVAILKCGYRGCRYSFGYPACPDLEPQVQLLDLLDADRIGVVLGETYQMVPEASTSAFVFHHPSARYFSA